MHASSPHRCCTFRVGDACFAVPADGVVEVLRGGQLTRVPKAPAGILGLVHLRGRIVPVVDPAGTLGIDRPLPERATHLVIALEDDWYGLVIDEPYTARLKKQFPCWCGSKNCRGTLLAPKKR